MVSPQSHIIGLMSIIGTTRRPEELVVTASPRTASCVRITFAPQLAETLLITRPDYSWNDVNQRRRQIRDNADSDFREKEHQEQEILRVAGFCQNNVDCRRTQVLGYYDETFNPALCSQGCDNCRDPSGIEEEDVTDMAVKIIRLAEALVDGGKHSVTRNQLLDVLWGKASASARGTTFHSHEMFGCGKDFPRDRSERITDRLENMSVFKSVSKQNGEWSAAYLEVCYFYYQIALFDDKRWLTGHTGSSEVRQQGREANHEVPRSRC